jgi:arylsulfatase A-like enzyme
MAVLAVGLIALLGGVSCSHGRRERPNLVLIVVDTLRADHLGCYSYKGIETPHVDDLAAGGVLVENAVTNVPLTLPSISTIMTSTLPPTHGVHYNEGFALDDSALTLAEILHGEGYQTRAVVGAVVLDSVNGISQGFDRYDDDFGEFTAYQPHVKIVESQLSHTQRRAREVTDLGLRLVDSMVKERPFFLFLHYFDPHSPYDPPPPYSPAENDLNEGPGEAITRLYDGEIAYTDAEIGRLIDGLRERHLVENTLIVLTADHGEGLGEHGEKSHGYLTYEGTMHVPLIYSMPGRLPANVEFSGLAPHVDIVPTILDILEIRWKGKYDLCGDSLFPFRDGKGARFTYFEAAMTYIVFDWCALRGIRGARWKYISAPREELYDLTSDPRERDNLIDVEPEVADSMRERLDTVLASTKIYHGGDGGREMSSGRGIINKPGFAERLKALGYVTAPERLDSSYEEMFDRSLPDPKSMMEAHERSQAVLESIGIAEGLIRGGKYRECIQLLEGLEGTEDLEWTIQYTLGLAYMGISDRDRAEREFREALASAPIGPGRVKIREALQALEAGR